MSRISYSDGEEDRPGQFALWAANIERSTKGKLGQAALRELEAALLAMPRKRLVRHVVACEGDVCAVGALLATKRATERGVSFDDAIAQLEGELGPAEDQCDNETQDLGMAAGIPRLVAWKLVALNDLEFDYWCGYVPGPETREDARYGWRARGWWLHREYTPEERYEKVLAWVQEHLASAQQVVG